MSQLKGELCLSVSNFFVHPFYSELQPTYHCIAAYHPPITEEAYQEWLETMVQKIPNSVGMFFNLQDQERIEQKSRFSKKYYLKCTQTKENLNKIDLTRAILSPQSVTIMALQIAIYMGCHPICH